MTSGRGIFDHLAALVLSVGAVAVVLAATPYAMFDLDRHAVPKELALHVTALLAGACSLLAVRRAPPRLANPDRFFALYLAWCTLSALVATNHWLSLRALAISTSTIVCCWSARRTASILGSGALHAAVTAAITLAVTTGLAQAYGLELPVFAESRAPGGTFGNRNFLAHVAAFGVPLAIGAIARARGTLTATAWTAALGAMTAFLFLSRSRAAWLGTGAGLGMLLLWALVGARPALDAALRRRLGLSLAAMATAILLALVVPNDLEWRSRNPYGETVSKLVDGSEGSGRGRLIQYRNTARMALQHPVLGVGPGNWAVHYPEVKTPGDPAYTVGATVPTNPWPSSDWVALVAERGVGAVLLLAFAFVGLAWRAWTTARTGAPDERAGAWAAAGMAAAFVTVGTFDAVLLNAAPSLLFATALGALVPVGDPPARRREPSTRARRLVLGAIGVVLVAGVVRSTQQLVALGTYAGARSLAAQTRAAEIDPGNYRMRWTVGAAWLARGQRERGCPHARAAGRQFPYTEAAVKLARRCGTLRGD